MGEPGVSSAARAGPARTGGRGSTLAPNYKDDDEPHVDEGDGAMHGAPRSAPSTSTGDTSQGRVRRGRPRRSTGGGDRARAASTARRLKGGAGCDGSRSPRRSTRDVSASPPPRVRDVYALETLSVGSPAGLANPTASCVHMSGPTPDEKQERESKDLSDYHLTKLQPHPTAVATELQTPSPPQNVDVPAAPTAPSSPGITREADAEATRLMRVAEMLQTGGKFILLFVWSIRY